MEATESKQSPGSVASAVTVEFTLNHLAFRYATVVVRNPYQVGTKRGVDTGGRYVDSFGSKVGYVLKNTEVYGLIKAIIKKLPYLRYNRRALIQVKVFSKTLKQFKFTLDSEFPGLHKVFLSIWKKGKFRGR